MDAKKLEDIRKSTVRSDETLHFLEVEGKYYMCFLRADNSSMDTGAKTEEQADVTQTVAATDVTGWAPKYTLSRPFMKDDPVCMFMHDMVYSGKVGGEVYTNLIELQTWQDGGKVAYKCQVSVVPTSFPNEAQNIRRVEADINVVGDFEKGTAEYDKDTGVATFTPAEE